MRRAVRWVALGPLVGVAAGCGGDDRSERDRAGFRDFKSKTEAACEDVADGLRRRGAPANSTDIPRLAPPGWVQKDAAEFGSALGRYRKLTADAVHALELRIPAEPGAAPDAIVAS